MNRILAIVREHAISDLRFVSLGHGEDIAAFSTRGNYGRIGGSAGRRVGGSAGRGTKAVLRPVHKLLSCAATHSLVESPDELARPRV